MKAKIEAAYLDWFNNFLSVAGYADYYGIPIDKARHTIDLGRRLHYKKAQVKGENKNG